MLLLGTGADSDVYKSDDGEWVYKVYRKLGFPDIVWYNELQDTLSRKLEKRNTFCYDTLRIGGLKSRKSLISILSHSSTRILEGSMLSEDFAGKAVAQVPYVGGISLDSIDENDINDAFDTADTIRNYLIGVIDFPRMMDINPCNIKLIPGDGIPKLIITDIAAEIEALLDLSL